MKSEILVMFKNGEHHTWIWDKSIPVHTILKIVKKFSLDIKVRRVVVIIDN